MHAKLQINRSTSNSEEIERIFNLMAPGKVPKKFNLIRNLLTGLDQNVRRKEFAGYHYVSARTVNRWVNEYNTWGLAGILESPARPGPKRKMKQWEFYERILPEAERLAKTSGKVTIKSLFQAAQGTEFNGSYATFRRLLGGLPAKYRRSKIQPTVAEWLVYRRTGQ